MIRLIVIEVNDLTNSLDNELVTVNIFKDERIRRIVWVIIFIIENIMAKVHAHPFPLINP